jgi:hypothetical protein
VEESVLNIVRIYREAFLQGGEILRSLGRGFSAGGLDSQGGGCCEEKELEQRTVRIMISLDGNKIRKVS